MQKPDDIPEDVWAQAKAKLFAAYDALEERAGRGSFITNGVWEALIEASARAILAERERCLAIMNMKMPVVLGPNDWTNYVVGPLPEELLRSKV